MPVKACKPLYIGWGVGEEEGERLPRKEAADLCVKMPALLCLNWAVNQQLRLS